MRSPVSKLGPVDLDYYHRNTSYMLRHDVVGIGGWEGGGGGWFLESLRAVCPTCLPCSQALRFPRTPELSLGGCHSPVLQGYALHSAAVRGTQASQAPLPTLFSLDDFKLGKLPVRGFAICVARAHGIFYSLSLEVRPLQSRVVTCRGACFQTFFLLPIAIIW